MKEPEDTMETANNNDKQTEEKCPCHLFSTSSQVISALHDSEKTQMLIAWLEGNDDYMGAETDEQGKDSEFNKEKNVRQRRKRTCNKRYYHHHHVIAGYESSQCPNRVGAAFSVLNSIRDGCREILEHDSKSMSSFTSSVVKGNNSENYDDAFPSLSTQIGTAKHNQNNANMTILTARKKPKDKKITSKVNPNNNNNNNSGATIKVQPKVHANTETITKVATKRRIRPAPAKPTAMPAISPWRNNIEKVDMKAQNGSNHGASSNGNIQTWTRTHTAEKALSKGKKSTDIDPMERVMNCKKITSTSNKKTEDTMDRVMNSNSRTDSSSNMGTSIQRKNTLKSPLPSSVPTHEHLIPIALKNLVDYTSKTYLCIIQNQLMPSVVLELQLMLRLLSLNINCEVKKKVKSKKDHDDSSSLQKMFQTGYLCQQFAIAVLKQLKPLISFLGQDILLPILNLKSMIDHLPEEVQELRLIIGSRMNEDTMLLQGNYEYAHNNENGIIGGRSTILNTPFQEKRDSRHNFRSRDLGSIYNNREQCRDSFLFQLRAFQQIRGNVLNPTQIEKSLNGIRQASRKVIELLVRSNMSWFAEFFTELLLQIGLVPMQETDADILKNVSDKDKLQKLHSRFTSKVVQKNKSSHPLYLNDNSENSGTSPEHFFPGHQEFFFLFIQAVDSYIFGIHLRNHLVKLISSMWSSNELKGVEERILQLQLLAKFLGVLAFSPNWDNKSPESSSNSDAFTTASETSPILDIREFIVHGWKQGKLITTIPWVLSFFWMISWDKISMEREYYKEIFSFLRYIHKRVNMHVYDANSCIAQNFFLLSLQMESFFSHVVGLSGIECLPYIEIGESAKHNFDDDKVLDSYSIQFSKLFVLSCSSHLDELQKLVVDLARSGENSMTSNNVSKKLKPYVLSSLPSGVDLGLFGKHDFDSFYISNESNDQVLLSSISSAGDDNNRNDITRKLVDSFFHQHKELHQLCDFIVDVSVKNVTKTIVKECIGPKVCDSCNRVCTNTSMKLPIDLEWYLHTLRSIELETVGTAREYLNGKLRKYIVQAMDILTPPLINVQVKDIATSLSLKHASLKGETVVYSLTRTEAKKKLDEELKRLNNDQMSS